MKRAKRSIESATYQCPHCLELLHNPTNYSTIWTEEDFKGKDCIVVHCLCGYNSKLIAPLNW